METSGSPIKREVGGVFIPVSDINRARAWYRDILGLPVGEVVMGHLCCIPMDNGPDLLLDQKLTPDGEGTKVQFGAYPLFMFSVDDIDASLSFLRGREVEILEYGGKAIQNGHWFNFRDCEGNLLMMCAPVQPDPPEPVQVFTFSEAGVLLADGKRRAFRPDDIPDWVDHRKCVTAGCLPGGFPDRGVNP